MSATPEPMIQEQERVAALLRGERVMLLVRIVAVVFAAGQVLTYNALPAPPGTTARGLALAGVIGLSNLVIWAALRPVRTLRAARALTAASVALDATVAVAFVWVYAFDPTSALWAILFIVILEGATRLQLAGALGVWAYVAVAYAWKEVWASARYDYPLEWNSITFRMGIGLLIGMIGGLMARDLERQRLAAAERGRDLARVTQAAARASSQRLQALFDAAPLTICELDLSGRVRRWSAAAEATFGLPADAVIDQVLPPVPDEEQPAFDELLASARAGAARTGVEVTMCDVAGQPRHLTVATAPLRDDDGAIDRVLLIATDDTERKRVEQQALQAQRMEAVGRLAGGIAHDFNNLMTVVLGYAQTARRKLAVGRSVDADLDAIAMAGRRASELVAQLLAFARQQRLEPRVVHLDALVHGLHPLLARLIPEHVHLEVATEAVPPVLADPGQLEQVVVNLVINARDAMPEGGTVTIRIGRAAASDAARADAPLEGEWVELSVADTGIGMTPEVKARIFEPFFTTKAPGKGTGLGLSMVYGTVEASGGRLAVVSEPGEGTTVTVHLPAHTPAPDETPASSVEDPTNAAVAPGEEGGAVVLVAEDEPSLRQLVAMTLELGGFHVLAAEDGAAALRIAEQTRHPIALVVTDVVMPNCSGPQMLAELRRADPNLPAVVMSGYADSGAGEVAVDDEYTVFLPKPFEPEALHSAVLRLLEDVPRAAQAPRAR